MQSAPLMLADPYTDITPANEPRSSNAKPAAPEDALNHLYPRRYNAARKKASRTARPQSPRIDRCRRGIAGAGHRPASFTAAASDVSVAAGHPPPRTCSRLSLIIPARISQPARDIPNRLLNTKSRALHAGLVVKKRVANASGSTTPVPLSIKNATSTNLRNAVCES